MTATMTQIHGTTYYTTVSDDGREVLLEKKDGSIYAVTRGEHATTCTCPHFEHVVSRFPGGACKHVVAIESLGLLADDAELDPIGDEPIATEPDPITRAEYIQGDAQGFVNDVWFQSFGVAGGPRIDDLDCILTDGFINWRTLRTNLLRALIEHDAYQLDGAPEPPAKLSFERVGMARRLLALPVWTQRHYALSRILEGRLEDSYDDNADLIEELASAHKEWLKINSAKPFPDAPPVSRPVACSRAPRGEAKPIPSKPIPAPRRGRKPKYTHIDWNVIAGRVQSGESRAKLARELGIPSTVVYSHVRTVSA